MELTKQQRQQLAAILDEAAVCHLIGEVKAENGKFSPNNRIYDYQLHGEEKSLYIDWRTHEQIVCGRFSYSADFIEGSKEYDMIIVVDESDFHHCLRWFPAEVESGRFAKSYLEDDDEAIYTINFGHYEQKT